MQVEIKIDKASLNKIKDGLEKLFPTDAKTNAALLRVLKKSAIPYRQTLKQLIRKEASKTKSDRQRLGYKTGKLAKSIRIFPSKRNTKANRPSVFVGPLVRPPKRLRNKMKKMSEAERHESAKNFANEQSGFYFYFLEYGFRPRGGELVKGLNLLGKTNQIATSTVFSRLESDMFNLLNKQSMKLLGVPLK
tara:strand:+ start:1386 stop:1958 length:573 start_codon:yes stop_codon:yes gene_type:complete